MTKLKVALLPAAVVVAACQTGNSASVKTSASAQARKTPLAKALFAAVVNGELSAVEEDACHRSSPVLHRN